MYATTATTIAIIIPIGITNGSSHVSLNFFAIYSRINDATTATTNVITDNTPAPSPNVSGLPLPAIARATKAPIRPINTAGVKRSINPAIPLDFFSFFSPRTWCYYG